MIDKYNTKVSKSQHYFLKTIIIFFITYKNIVCNKYTSALYKLFCFQFQIISCGCGFDTTYWKLSESNLLKNDSVFLEIDFPSVIKKKLYFINKSPKLKSFLIKPRVEQKNQRVNQISNNYYLLEADLCELDIIESLFSKINVDYNIPTLFLSECVITYMKEDR